MRARYLWVMWRVEGQSTWVPTCGQVGHLGASKVLLVVKNPLANAGDLRDTDLIPGMGRSLGGGNSNQLQYSFLQNPMAKEPGGLQSTRLQRVGHY